MWYLRDSTMTSLHHQNMTAKISSEAGRDDPPFDRLDDALDAVAQHVGMHAERGADSQHERADRAQRRPRAGVDEVIGMLLRAPSAMFIHPFQIRWRAVPPSKVFARSVLASKKVYESVMVRMLS